MVVEWLFLAVPRGYLRFVIVVFPDHTHLLFLVEIQWQKNQITFGFDLKLCHVCFGMSLKTFVIPITTVTDYTK